MSEGKAFDVDEFAEHFDHHSPEYAAHTYEIYEHMREKCPVAHSDAYGGMWVVTRYRDIMKIARDDKTFSSAQGITMPMLPPANGAEDADPTKHGPTRIPIIMDPPRSREFRKLLDPLFTPRVFQAMEPDIRRLATERIDGFIESGEGDLVHDLAQPLTAIMTLRLGGLPQDQWREYADPIHRVIWGDGLPEELYRARMGVTNLVKEQVRLQRREPVPGGLIEHLMGCTIDGRPLEDWEVVAIIELLLDGGVDTTQALLGSAFIFLARNPDYRQQLIDDPALIPDATEEFLRVFAPQQALARTVTEDTEIGGVPMKKGEKVMMCWASGNRDEAEFENADQVIFGREENRHMTFGVGSHRCMGSNLARMEIRVCLEEVLSRLPDYELDEAGIESAPDVGVVYGYKRVPVRFSPGPRRRAESE